MVKDKEKARVKGECCRFMEIRETGQLNAKYNP
jgi:hypothetical protein